MSKQSEQVLENQVVAQLQTMGYGLVHIIVINKCKPAAERIFYFEKIIENQWSVAILEHHINSHLYQNQKKSPPTKPKGIPQSKQTYFKTTSPLTTPVEGQS